MSHIKRFIDLVKHFVDKEWDWIEVFRNYLITMSDIIDNPDLPWNWRYGVSSNPNLTNEYF